VGEAEEDGERTVRVIVPAVLLAVTLASLAASQDKPDFSGTWVREGSTDGFTLLRATIGRMAVGAATWEQFANGIRSAREYQVVIKQTDDALSIEFPASSGLLNQIPYIVDGVEHTTVRDSAVYRGMWTKFITKADWRGVSVAVRGTAFSDFYARADPTTVLAEPEHGGFRNPVVEHVLTLNNGRLAITTTVSDEKGEAVFRQQFLRSPRARTAAPAVGFSANTHTHPVRSIHPPTPILNPHPS
jgi:hypothetical protein